MNLHFTNIDQGLIIFYTTTIIVASLAYLSARASRAIHAPRRRHRPTK